MRDLQDLNITNASHGAAFTVKVVPKAARTEIVGIMDDGTIKIRLMAAPTDNQANMELIEFLAQLLQCRRDDIEIVAGEKGRRKWISVLNVSASDVEAAVRTHAPEELIPEEDD